MLQNHSFYNRMCSFCLLIVATPKCCKKTLQNILLFSVFFFLLSAACAKHIPFFSGHIPPLMTIYLGWGWSEVGGGGGGVSFRSWICQPGSRSPSQRQNPYRLGIVFIYVVGNRWFPIQWACHVGPKSLDVPMLPPAWLSSDFHWLSRIIVDFPRLSLIDGDYRRLPSTIVDYRWLSLIIVYSLPPVAIFVFLCVNPRVR